MHFRTRLFRHQRWWVLAAERWSDSARRLPRSTHAPAACLPEHAYVNRSDESKSTLTGEPCPGQMSTFHSTKDACTGWLYHSAGAGGANQYRDICYAETCSGTQLFSREHGVVNYTH